MWQQGERGRHRLSPPAMSDPPSACTAVSRQGLAGDHPRQRCPAPLNRSIPCPLAAGSWRCLRCPCAAHPHCPLPAALPAALARFHARRPPLPVSLLHLLALPPHPLATVPTGTEAHVGEMPQAAQLVPRQGQKGMQPWVARRRSVCCAACASLPARCAGLRAPWLPHCQSRRISGHFLQAGDQE